MLHMMLYLLNYEAGDNFFKSHPIKKGTSAKLLSFCYTSDNVMIRNKKTYYSIAPKVQQLGWFVMIK